MSRVLDILHVTETLAHGGAEQNLLSVIRELPSSRFRNHLAWLYDENLLLEEFRPHVVSLVPLRTKSGLGLAVAATRLARWIRQNRPDVVHCQLIRAELVGRAAALLAGHVPVVTTWQNTFYDEPALGEFGNSQFRRGVVRWVDQLSGKLDRRFIAVSEHVAAHCSAKLDVDRSRIRVIHNAIDPNRCEPVAPAALIATRSELGFAENVRLVLAVGRLVAQKGHSDLIDSLPKVVAACPDVVLLIVGAGPLRQQLQDRIDRVGMRAHARLLGARRDVPALYQLADVFAFPSRYEGLSVALIEALANGLPAVSSDIAQNREIGHDVPGITFVRCEDIDGWATAIIDALRRSRSERGTMKAARSSLREAFSPKVLAAAVGEELTRAAS